RALRAVWTRAGRGRASPSNRTTTITVASNHLTWRESSSRWPRVSASNASFSRRAISWNRPNFGVARDRAVAAWASLFGAYYPPGDPVASGPFAVDLHGPDDLSALLRGELGVRARVRAEGLAIDAAATARLSLCFPDLLCKLTFLSDAGRTQDAVVVTRFG